MEINIKKYEFKIYFSYPVISRIAWNYWVYWTLFVLRYSRN
jgi:hypothetical protein